MSAAAVKDLIIVGRDAPVWLAASVMQFALAPAGVKVVVIELPSEVAPPDVYATLPALEPLHSRLGIDEGRLVGATQATFSLGKNFIDIAAGGPSFFHPYGSTGARIDNKEFLPNWVKACRFGLPVAFEDFCLTAVAAKQGRMLVPDPDIESYGFTDYAYHLPAIPYAAWLKVLALRRGVAVHEARVINPVLHAEEGAIAAIELDGGRRVAGDFFLDVTGAQSQLLGSALGVSRESSHEEFVADRMLVAFGAPIDPVPIYSEIRACADGWVGLYPSQACTHVVYTYSSELTSDDAALRAATSAARIPLNGAVVRKRQPGRCTFAWERNCVAIGEAAATFDPIHAVELQALQIGLVHLLPLFPVRSEYAVERAEYNQNVRSAFERIRDFQAAHYLLNRYGTGPFWAGARQVPPGDKLRHKIDAFRARGDVVFYEDETFMIDDWQALLIGHGVMPESYDPAIDRTSPDLIKNEFRRILGFIRDKVQEQCTHSFYLQSVCAPAGRNG
jgi:tryptophan halogenase